MVIKMWRQEWVVESFTLKYHTPEHFTRCHWQKAEKVISLWIVYRAFTALYFILSLIYTLTPFGQAVPEENSFKYLIFLTHWTYLLECFQFVLALVIVVLRVVAESKNPTLEPMSQMPWYYQVYWVFFTITISSALIVTIIFWASVYDPVLYPVTVANVMEHCLNSVFVIIDFWLVGHPVKFLHFYFPLCYGLLYAIFSLIYQQVGGKGVKGEVPIYDILDWRSPGTAVGTTFFCLLFLMFIHFLYSAHSFCKFSVNPKPARTANN